MKKLLLNVLILLFLLPTLTKSLGEDISSVPENCGKDFKCILKHMEFKIPDQEVLVENMKIKLSKMVIYEFDINYMNISYFPDENQVSNSIILKLQINVAKMNGTINIPSLLISNVNANAVLLNLTAEIPLDFLRGEDNLFENITILIDSFYTHLDNFTINARGGSSFIIKPFLPTIEKAALGFANNYTIIYSLLNPLIEKYGRQLFELINSYIRSEVNGPDEISIPLRNIQSLIPIVQSPIIDLFRYLLNDLVADKSNPLNFNNLVNRFMGDTPGVTLTALSKEFGFKAPIVISALIPESQTTVNFIIDEFSIFGFNTWSDLSFLNPDPNSRFILDSHANLGNLKINVSTTLNFMTVDFNTSAVSNLSQDFDLYLELVDNTLDLDVQIAAIRGADSNFTNAQYTNFDCLSTLIDDGETGVTKLLLNTTFKRFDYDTKGVLDGFVFNIVSFVLDFFLRNNLDLVPKFLNGFIYEYLVKNQLKNEISNKTCPYLKDEPIKEIDIPITIISFSGAVFLSIIMGIILIAMLKVMKRYNEKMSKLDEDEKPKVSCTKNFFRTDDKASLMMHPAIPLWVRLIVPLLIFTNIALFISSNSGLGAGVFLKLLVGKDTKISLPSLFNFGLINSITEMWAAKSYFLSILICVLSCLWPYTKLVIMIIVWMLPSTVLKVHIRSRILRVLDELGKWSLLDSYVMTLMLIAFHIKLNFPIVNTKDLTSPTYLSIWVYPGYGFITLILGTLMSLALSHIICIINRRAKKYNKEEKISSTKKGVYKTQHWALNLLLVIILVVALGLFSFGIVIKSSSFDFAGLAGWFIDLLDKPTKKAYSIIDLGVGIPDAAEFPNSFGVRITQVIFFIVTVVVPYIHMLALFFLLFLPMTKQVLLKFYYVCETLYAWSCLDVFIISILATVMEISQLTQFLVADKCDFITPIIENYFSEEYLIKGHERCFVVITRVLPGSYILIAATLLHTIATMWINIKARKLSKDEESSLGPSGETHISDEPDMEDIDSNSPYVSNDDLKSKSKSSLKKSKESSLNSFSDSIMSDLVKDSKINVISDVEEPTVQSVSDTIATSDSQNKNSDTN